MPHSLDNLPIPAESSLESVTVLKALARAHRYLAELKGFPCIRQKSNHPRRGVMSEYTEVEQPFLQQLSKLGWISVDQGQDIPQAPNISLRKNFRQWLPVVFENAVVWLSPVQMVAI